MRSEFIRKFESFILRIWVLGESLTQFYPFSTQENIIIRQKFPLNFITVSGRLTNIFGIKSNSRTEVHIFNVWGLKIYGPISTIFS